MIRAFTLLMTSPYLPAPWQASVHKTDNCGSVGGVDWEFTIEGLAVQILSPTVHMSEVSLGKTLKPKLYPLAVPCMSAPTHFGVWVNGWKRCLCRVLWVSVKVLLLYVLPIHHSRDSIHNTDSGKLQYLYTLLELYQQHCTLNPCHKSHHILPSLLFREIVYKQLLLDKSNTEEVTTNDIL